MAKKFNLSTLNFALSLLSIILILLGLFFIYIGVRNIINNQSSNPEITTDNSPEGRINVGISVTKVPDPTKVPSDPKTNPQKLTADQKSLETQEVIKKTGKWKATDYVAGDIPKGKYVVKQGDTLWEIAEAVYGNGSQWTKILARNKSIIKKLPNGQQALIFPGQTLVIE